MTRPRSRRSLPVRVARVRATRLAVALALTFTAACTGGGADGGTERGASAGAGVAAGSAADSRHIFVASGRDVTGKGGIRQQLIDDWNAAQEEEAGDDAYQAHLVELSGSADQQRSQLLGALQSGSARYDVLNLDVTWIPEFAAAGLIGTLDESLIDDDVIASVGSTARWNGDVYAAPFNSDVGLLYYRPDYLEKAGLRDPDLSEGVETWSELAEVIGDVDSKKPRKYEKGWTTQLEPYEGRTVNAIEAFASADNGPALTDGEGRYTGTVQGLENGVTELRTRTADPLTLPDADTSDEAESLSDFAAGRTAFLRHWPYAYGALHQIFEAGKLGVMPLPGKAVLGGQNLAVARSSGHAEVAEDLIRFLTGPESQCRLLQAGFAATRESAYDEDADTCQEKSDNGAPTEGSGESTDRMPRDDQGRPAYASRTLLTALKNAEQRPRTPHYGAFTHAFITALGPLFSDSPPNDRQLAEALDKALREALPTADRRWIG
ncbi:extracellular solute-binding protein [Streptomyces niveus]|uniref:extracellular solute-binding protein n=1 Tax=Streptomyces niveus TaxID=193462 RepID=UPI0033B831E5